MKGVLDGIRVLEWAIAYMVPSATSVLGDLGAEVIKIEGRITGDPHRGLKRTDGVSLETPGDLLRTMPHFPLRDYLRITYSWEIDPDYPMYPFVPDARKTIIAK